MNGTAAVDDRAKNGRKRRKSSIQQRFDRIVDKCTDFLTKKLAADNCIEMILFADEYRLDRLRLMAASFMDNNFEMIFTSDQFIELEPHNLAKLLGLLFYDQLTEDEMRNAIIFWAKYKRSERKMQINQLLTVLAQQFHRSDDGLKSI